MVNGAAAKTNIVLNKIQETATVSNPEESQGNKQKNAKDEILFPLDLYLERSWILFPKLISKEKPEASQQKALNVFIVSTSRIECYMKGYISPR